MVRRTPSAVLLVAVPLLAICTVGAVRAFLLERWAQAPLGPPQPLAVELIEPRGTALARPTRGMSVGRDGFGTVLSAPARRLVPSPTTVLAGGPTLTAEPVVAGQAAKFVRLFARLVPAPPSNDLVVSLLQEPPPRFGTIILRDGCLKLAEPGEPHALFPFGTKLYIDGEGYLTVGVIMNGTATNPRVGEAAWWQGGTQPLVEAGAVARIRAKCGPGAAKPVGLVQSVSASQAAADGYAARDLASMYGLAWPTALAKIRRCRLRLARNSGIDPLRMIGSPCGSTPPSPVDDPRSCPSGTSLSGGLCRTPSGHVRPIPEF